MAFSGAQSIPLSLFAVTESDINNSRLLSFRARSRLATESRLFNVDFWFQESRDSADKVNAPSPQLNVFKLSLEFPFVGHDYEESLCHALSTNKPHKSARSKIDEMEYEVEVKLHDF